MRRLVPVIAVAVLFACRDQSPSVPPVLEPSLPSAAIIDGGEGHGGNPFFFWLAPQWIYASFPGEANQDLSPTAAICRWDGSACVGADVAVFRRSDGTITTGTESDYIAIWKTWEANPRTNEVFRIRVLLGPYELGARDVKFVDPDVWARTPPNNPDFAPIRFPPGFERTPEGAGPYTIRFRIEEGALLYAQGIDPSNCNDCAEGSVSADSDETTVIITPSGRAAAVIEPESLPAGVNEVNIIIERLTSPCLPTDTQQYPACYRYLAVPDIEFTQDVIVEVCLESIASYAVGQVQLHKVKEIQDASGDWVPDGEVIPLPNVPATNITCGSPVILSAFARRHPRLARGVRAVVQPLAKLLGPNVAWADDEGFGGTTGSFSRVSWARGVALAIESGDGAQFTTGEGTVAAVVSVTPLHYSGVTPPPAASVPLSYVFVLPDGSPAGLPQSVLTDGAGQATITWPLATLGAHELVVTAPGTNLGDLDGGTIVPRPVPQVTFTAAVSFEDDFSADFGWATTGLWNRTSLVGIFNQAYPTYVQLAPGDGSAGELPAPAAGSHAFWYGRRIANPALGAVRGNYLNQQAAGDAANSGGTSVAAHGGRLVSPPLRLPAAPALHEAVFRLQTWFEIEGFDAHAADLMVISVRDVTNPLAPVETMVDMLNPTVDPDGAPNQPFTSGGFDSPPVWLDLEMDLSAYFGRTIQLVFDFATGDQRHNGFRGWIVDDVRLTVEPTVLPSAR